MDGEVVIGKCSLCGGDVVEFRGAWYSTSPPPEAHCRGCGATREQPTIRMERRSYGMKAGTVDGIKDPAQLEGGAE